MTRSAYQFMKWAMIVGGGSVLLNGACLPDNFWAGKWGEVVNRGIFGVINVVLGAMTGGGVQI